MAFFVDLSEHVERGNPSAVRFNGDANGANPLRRTDPAGEVAGASPNFGQFAFPHVMTFAGVLSSMSRVYRPSDEALRDSWANARKMRNDLTIMECVEARQRGAALLNLHVEAPEEKDGSQKALAGTLQKMLTSIPRFMQYRENLLNAVFYGRYAVANRWRWKNIAGGRRIVVDKWRPVHGDKLVWRYDTSNTLWDEDQVGVRVGLGYSAGETIAGRWTVEKVAQVAPTDLGLAYFLRPWERPLLAIHKHYIEDGEFEAPEHAGRVHGVGIRSRIYWTWYQKQETLAWLMEFLERSASGFEVWYYPFGNDQAKVSVAKAAKERHALGRNVVLVPRFLQEDSFGQPYDRIEPSMAGAEALKSIIVEYFGHLLKRYILGQTLTTESAGTGLGSNLADVHLATFLQIIKYDTTNLEETLTTDLLEPMIRYNFPWAVGLPFKVRIDTESENAHEKLEAYEKAFNMGLKLRAQDIYDLIGATKPSIGDETLDKSTQGPTPGSLGDMLAKGARGADGPQSLPPSHPAGEVGQDDKPEAELFAARPWNEADHPRGQPENAGEFAAAGNLPGLPSGKERKVDTASTGGDFMAAMAAADKRGDVQYRSAPGQQSLFGGDDASADAQHLAPVHAAAQRGAINAEQASTAAAWVKQHGHHPAWFTMGSGSLFKPSGAPLIGRVDRGDESFAVHIDADGETRVYHWPGFGKQKKMRFASTLIPLHQTKPFGTEKATPAVQGPPRHSGMLFSRAQAVA